MAEPSLIEAYLTELRYSTARMAGSAEIAAEAEDHLLSSVEVGIARGLSPAAAEADALARYGSASLVSHTFIEEEKRGGAVSTLFTRRAGLAAMLAPPLVIIGELGNENIDRGALHGLSLFILFGALVAFVVALIGIRQRHGGMGTIGRVAFWLFVASPFLAAPFSWGAGGAWIVIALVVVTLVGIGMLQAHILPRGAAWMFTLTPAVTLLATAATIATADDAGDYQYFALIGIAAFGLGLMWIGWSMWQEPALDQRAHAEPGRMATA